MNIKLASLVLTVALAATACANPDRSSSGQQDVNGRVLSVDSTQTLTATVPPPFIVIAGLEMESTAVLNPFPTETPQPLMDPNFDPILFPWFDGPSWDWFPLTLP